MDTMPHVEAQRLGPEPEFEPRYDMTEGEVQSVVGDYLHGLDQERLGALKSPFVGVVVRNEDGQITNAARWLECRVFDDAFSNSPKDMHNMYQQCEDDSTFLLVLHRASSLPVGVMRVVGGESAWQLSLQDAPNYIGHSTADILKYHKMPGGRELTGKENAWDAATAAVAEEYRRKMIGGVAVTALLERMFILEGRRQNVEPIFTMLDARARRSLESIGTPFKPMAGHDTPFPYYGSKRTYAMHGYFPHFAPSIVDKYNELRARPFILDFLRGPREALKKRFLARAAGMIALGKHDIDSRIFMTETPEA